MRFVFIFCLLINSSFAQTLIKSDDMESTSIWRGASTTGTNSSFVGGLSNIIDNPSNYPMYSSFDTCYQVRGNGLGSSTVELDTFLYPNTIVRTGRPYQIRFKLASFGLNPATQTAAGVDQTDWIELQYTLNNGLSWWRDAQIQGISNAMWSFNGAIGTGARLNITRTGSTSTTTPTIFTSNASNPIVSVAVTIPFTTVTQIRIRFVTNINATGETFMLDDVEIWDMTNTLPVELIEFNGKQTEQHIKLFWSTASEVNNDGFQIEKSYNGLDFNSIAYIKGQGNTTNISSYSYTDSDIDKSIVYYRLKQIDFDGVYKIYYPIALEYLNQKSLNKLYWYNLLGQEVK